MIGKDGVLTVRPAPRAPEPEPEPEPAPAPAPAPPRPALRPTAPQAQPAEAKWGLRNEDETPDLLAQLQGRMAGFNVRTPDDFTALPLATVQALFASRRLDRGLRFGPDPGDSLFGARARARRWSTGIRSGRRIRAGSRSPRAGTPAPPPAECCTSCTRAASITPTLAAASTASVWPPISAATWNACGATRSPRSI
ncbi:hypothetical protein [Lysobacter gummosus]|uniref:hypothetical protein n=1 Tax=Lysobacter gummosus TaxID=262324 RepID=UPI003640052F